MSPNWKTAVLAFLVASSISIARCEEAIKRASDVRYLVDLNGVTVALPDEDPKDQQTGFYVASPPGKSPFHFYLNDLLRDPERLASRLRSAEWVSVSVGSSTNHPREIIGVSVVKGVNRASILSAVDTNCEAWQADWARYRKVAIGLPADEYGWTRQDQAGSPYGSMFIKFLDAGGREQSRYYPVHCNFAGGCSLWACHDRLTQRISFYSSNKPKGEDYSVKEFDRQIASGKTVLERLLVNRSVDLSHP
ncbi:MULTISPECIES: hypothetical protein [unclassified Bradyrhizobium]|uniref:hypothetical protein n=1 Tax=unclassified Bradyrhizobium TaxID=2631580 RepID=UPI001FF9651A|nr:MULTISPECIES: hypothetical protein [unclassified Bradyrhizobium]MCK1537476.1 hypothetical protein [Bradyrhizobium sp. 176]MCK1554864.1 hypothetical protein [Bradyrhizobium sp. 171]